MVHLGGKWGGITQVLMFDRGFGAQNKQKAPPAQYTIRYGKPSVNTLSAKLFFTKGARVPRRARPKSEPNAAFLQQVHKKLHSKAEETWLMTPFFA